MRYPSFAGIQRNPDRPDEIPIFDVYLVDQGSYNFQIHDALRTYEPTEDDLVPYLQEHSTKARTPERVFEAAPVTTIGNQLDYQFIDLMTLYTAHGLLSYMPISLAPDIIERFAATFSEIEVYPDGSFDKNSDERTDATPIKTFTPPQMPPRITKDDSIIEYIAEAQRPLIKELVYQTRKQKGTPDVIETNTNDHYSFRATVKNPKPLAYQQPPGAMVRLNHVDIDDDDIITLMQFYRGTRREFAEKRTVESIEPWKAVHRDVDDETLDSIHNEALTEILEQLIEIWPKALAPFSFGKCGELICNRFEVDKLDYTTAWCPKRQA